jgi:hypothetical protein
MVLIAGCLGLRAGEIVGLQRGIVHGRVGDVKTEYSRDAVPIAPELTRELLAVPGGTNWSTARIDAPCQHCPAINIHRRLNDGRQTTGTRQRGGNDFEACR